MKTGERKPGGRSAQKHRAILDAARSAFLASGYDGASMDDIADAAGVSKPTIYKHFGDKDRLFTETIETDIAEAESHTQALIDALPTTRDLEADLRQFARVHLADVMQPHLVRMRRRLIGEAERFPDLAKSWYENGPAKGHETLARVFCKLADRGLLRMDDPLTAAEQFNWLVLIPLHRAMFTTHSVDVAELNEAADRAVRMFLDAYRPRSSRGTGSRRRSHPSR